VQLLIGYETGLVVLWDLREKAAECRYNCTEVRFVHCRQKCCRFCCLL